jgi:AraC-like DNA-binding protein
MAPAYLNNRGVCVFMHDSRQRSSPLRAHGLARRLLQAIHERCDLHVRIGVGGAVEEEHPLVESYDQALMALAQCADPVAAYSVPVDSSPDLFAKTEEICALLSQRLLPEALLAVRSLPVMANRQLGGGAENFARQQRFFCSGLYSMCFTAKQLGVARQAVDRILAGVDADMRRPASLCELHEFYLRTAEDILDEVRRLYRSRREKLVERSCRIINEHIEQRRPAGRLSPSVVAEKLGVSISSIERTFKRVTGCTFERFVMMQRMEFAKTLLLDPAYNVSQAAERCGFSEPAYFARVFRKITGCTPSEYMRSPLSFRAGAGGRSEGGSTPAGNVSGPSVPEQSPFPHSLA